MIGTVSQSSLFEVIGLLFQIPEILGCFIIYFLKALDEIMCLVKAGQVGYFRY